MKRIISMFLMLVPMFAMASIPEIEAIANDYSENQSVVYMTLNEEMIKMAAGDSSVPGVVSVDILTCEDSAISEEITPRVEALLNSDSYNLITNINDEGSIVKIYAFGDEGTSDGGIIVYVRDGGDLATIVVNGSISSEEFTNALLSQLNGAAMQ